MTVIVTGAVVIGGVRYPAQVEITIPEPVRRKRKSA